MNTMKAISMWQPYASLWLSPAKLHETRSWGTNHRGLLLVHASKRLVSDCGEEVDDICIEQFGPMWRSGLPRGEVIGVVDLFDCRPADDLNFTTEPLTTLEDDRVCGDFSAGRFAWQRGAYGKFSTPVLLRGRQRIFNVESDMIADEARRLISIAKGESA